MELVLGRCCRPISRIGYPLILFTRSTSITQTNAPLSYIKRMTSTKQHQMFTRRGDIAAASSLGQPTTGPAASDQVGNWGDPLDLTEDNVRRALGEARIELAQIFDESVGITGEVELAELDGPFVIIRLQGRFWHKRSMVVERLANFLRKRVPEILEVNIEDEKQLDDSPENF
ncbi:hypothetical protein Droror1_Dr00007845 [Drosera rotundifolia]